MEALDADVTQHGEQAQITLRGELDSVTAEQVRAIDVAALIAAGCRTVAIDLGGVSFLDSSGIGALVSLRNRASELDVPTTVSAAPAHIQHTLTLAGLAGLFGLTR